MDPMRDNNENNGLHDAVTDTLEERKELIEELFEKTEEYVKTNIQLAKYKAADKTGEIVGSLVAKATMVILGFFFLLMINIGIAFWLGQVLGRDHYGFMIVAGFYALLTLLVYIFRKAIIQTPISNTIITQILK
jgi:hypothetical protein